MSEFDFDYRASVPWPRGYVPLPTQGRLHLKLGYVGSGKMTKGSPNLAITGGALQGSLTASDIGTKVSVIFAGPDLPFVPRFPRTPDNATGTNYPGTMLVTTIVSITDSSNAVLHDAASNDTLDDSNNVVVYREVSADTNTPIKVQWTLTTSSRGTLTATIFDRYNQLNVLAGMPIYLYDDAEGDYFGGAIDTVAARNIPGRLPDPDGATVSQNPVYWDIQALSWSHVLDRRIVNPYYPNFGDPLTGPPGTVPPSGWNGPPAAATPSGALVPITGGTAGNSGVYAPGQFTNMYVGDIFNQLLFGYCDSEGLSSNCPNGVGPLINYFQANAGKDTIAQAVDNAAQAAYTANESWFWWIDAWKKAYLVKSQTFYNSWYIDETGLSGANSTDSSVLLTVKVTTTREKLANRAYIDSSQTVGPQRKEYYYTNHSNHSYSMAQPLGGAPKVWIQRDVATIWNQTVAVKGSPKQSAQWYWALGDNSIEQEQYTTLAQNCTADETTIHVVSPMLVNVDFLEDDYIRGPTGDPSPAQERNMIQIEDEFMRIRFGSTDTSHAPDYRWVVDRGATVRRIGANYKNDAAQHLKGASIYPAAMDDSNREFFVAEYTPLTKELFVGDNQDMIATRAGIESGRGLWETQISLGAPFYDPLKQEGQKLVNAFVKEYGEPPETFEAETYRPGLQIGFILYVHLLRPPVNANFLIDKLDFTAENNRQKWTIHAVNGALIGDWRKAFLSLNDQFAPLGGAGSTIAGAPGKLAAGVWDPQMAFPETGDPLFTFPSFGLAQDYLILESGAMGPQLTIRGKQPFDDIGVGIPIEIKVRREYVAGAAGVEGILDERYPSNIFLGFHPQVPLVANSFNGRIISKVCRPYADNKEVELRDFVIVAHDDQGSFTCTPPPFTNGCETGDVFVIRTGRAAGTAATAYDATSTPNTFTDPLFASTYGYDPAKPAVGLVPDGNVGNLAMIIGGTGMGQPRQLITANTNDTITVSPGWSTQPDATSCVVIIDSAAQEYTPALPTKAPDIFKAYFNVDNYYLTKTVRVEGYLKPSGVEEGAIETCAYRELYIWGAEGTRVVDYYTTQPMRYQDGLIIFDTSQVPPPTLPNGHHTTILVYDIDEQATLIVINDIYPAPNGTQIEVGPDGGPTERMFVIDGSGTTTVKVIRGWDKTTPIVHSGGDTVKLPGELTWTLVHFSQVPNKVYRFFKAWWGDDINYVRIVPATDDTRPNELPDGEPYHLLADSSSAYGSYDIKIPAV